MERYVWKITDARRRRWQLARGVRVAEIAKKASGFWEERVCHSETGKQISLGFFNTRERAADEAVRWLGKPATYRCHRFLRAPQPEGVA